MEKPFTSTPTPLDLSSLGPHESKLGKFHNLKKHTPIPRIDETHPVRRDPNMCQSLLNYGFCKDVSYERRKGF
jgi:hypothetical protein